MKRPSSIDPRDPEERGIRAGKVVGYILVALLVLFVAGMMARAVVWAWSGL